jgi:hypothetical protein
VLVIALRPATVLHAALDEPYNSLFFGLDRKFPVSLYTANLACRQDDKTVQMVKSAFLIAFCPGLPADGLPGAPMDVYREQWAGNLSREIPLPRILNISPKSLPIYSICS